MKIVLLTHAPFFKSKSMPKFAQMLASGLRAHNHEVIVYSPPSFFYQLSKILPFLGKWFGYIDQLLLFPMMLKFKLLRLNHDDTVFVFCDQALGPWIPLFKDLPHAIHVHDLLALKSAMGLEPINKTPFSGKLYQKYIRKGFECGKVFISVSNKTKHDLERFTSINPSISKVIYNGLNYQYKRLSEVEVAETLTQCSSSLSYKNYLLNVGANQWYKNREGLLYLYQSYIKTTKLPLPLVIVGPPPTVSEINIIEKTYSINPKANLLFYQDIGNERLNALYSGALCTLVPSHEEGFGWPIIESQASGTCVITTDNNPMAEIAGSHSILLSSTANYRSGKIDLWAEENNSVLLNFLSLSLEQRSELEKDSIAWAANFSCEKSLPLYIETYREALVNFRKE